MNLFTEAAGFGFGKFLHVMPRTRDLALRSYSQERRDSVGRSFGQLYSLGRLPRRVYDEGKN